jgi:hypothetical protein
VVKSCVKLVVQLVLAECRESSGHLGRAIATDSHAVFGVQGKMGNEARLCWEAAIENGNGLNMNTKCFRSRSRSTLACIVGVTLRGLLPRR